LPTQLSICTLIRSQSLAQSLSQLLVSDRYTLRITSSESEFFEFIDKNRQELDCLLLEDNSSLLPLLKRLSEQGTLLPVVIFSEESETSSSVVGNSQRSNLNPTTNDYLQRSANPLFHAAEVRLSIVKPADLGDFIDKAIARYIYLAPTFSLADCSAAASLKNGLNTDSFIIKQQQRLSEKLQERLGYLGVYYKRNPQFFFRNLPENERQNLLENLRSQYSQIILNYFSQDHTINKKIDEFVDQAFFADISVSRIVEIHMEVMDDFSKHLKLEGRSEEVLLDYRLTLIDVIAHLGEMYRRSIPREL